MGLEEQAPALRHEAVENRRKAYTLFGQTYEPSRRAACSCMARAPPTRSCPGPRLAMRGQRATDERTLGASHDPCALLKLAQQDLGTRCRVCSNCARSCS